ncbi:GNAT family N-acetyltransferase [Geodermatophilus aquaeductus]|uniref:L-amino acid N-acyltransferase YncA n=1 Tax=Geodermatophilus aquaeductus TaxID=1564161 RepID=A0A521FU11_9ACTN|nr:GNAT family N-acetyltransferase [Geodermatophilus aquaeductus]SMO99648.1 L-amino acid N-acyltransferase YncA [Geodermatophilus aquaeductus]
MDPVPALPRLTGTADVSVRPAVAGDAPEIARVQGETWRIAYRDVLPASALEAWDAGEAEAAWTAAVTRPPTPAHGVLVALEGPRVVGFAAYGPPELAADEQADPAGPTTELAVLLVEPRWGRRGHGSRLLAAVADLAAGNGTARLSAWVAEGDRVTAAFLESAGWARDGWARTLDADGTPLREVRWHTLLGGEE